MNRIWKIFLLLAMSALLMTAVSCGDDDDDDDNDAANDDDASDDDTSDDDDADDDWTPVEPKREEYENFTVVWLSGTPYQMGRQHGELLHDELAAGVAWLDSMHLIEIVTPIARATGLLDMAYEYSYPDIIEECRGINETAGDIGWTTDICMLLNFGDVLLEKIGSLIPFKSGNLLYPRACSQVSAMGDATTDGNLYHARSLDWDEIDFLLDYPVIFVRQPTDGIPHVYIGFPGNLSPYNGMNAMGVSTASDEADPLNDSFVGDSGRSHVQMQAMILKESSSLAEARQLVEEAEHISVEGIMVSDTTGASAFEMTATVLGIRDMTDGVVALTNHFVAEETKDADEFPTGDSSRRRYERLMQLATPDGIDTNYGQIDPEVMVSILRDRVNPDDGEQQPEGTFDNNSSIATNGAIYQVVFDPTNLWFWVAAGAIPVPEQTFVGFSLGELLELPDAQPVSPAVFE